MRTFKRSGSQSDRVAYVAARKIYKTLTRKKKMGYKLEKARRLASFDKDPRSFWRELRQLSGRKNRVLSRYNGLSGMNTSNVFSVESPHLSIVSHSEMILLMITTKFGRSD